MADKRIEEIDALRIIRNYIYNIHLRAIDERITELEGYDNNEESPKDT